MMFRNLFTVLAVLLSSVVCRAAEPQKQAEQTIEQWLESANRYSGKRVNGVMLGAKANLKGDAIHITWSLDYDGPRPPLIIQKPTYSEYSYGATIVRVIIPGPPVRMLKLEGRGTGPGLPLPIPRERFLTVLREKSADGILVVPLADIKKQFVKDYPQAVGDQPPATIYLQLIHRPQERGEEYDLDAWTSGPKSSGGLYAHPVMVQLRKP